MCIEMAQACGTPVSSIKSVSLEQTSNGFWGMSASQTLTNLPTQTHAYITVHLKLSAPQEEITSKPLTDKELSLVFLTERNNAADKTISFLILFPSSGLTGNFFLKHMTLSLLKNDLVFQQNLTDG